MKPTGALPAEYMPCGTLDLTRQKPIALGLALGSVVMFVAAWWLVLWLLPLLRADLSGLSISVSDLAELLTLFAAGLALLTLMVVLHEAIHGLAFWHYTGDRPAFGLRGWYAYAAAPGWYLPRKQYLVVGLAPLVLISLPGLLCVAFIPLPALLPLLLLITANIAGAVGDLAVVFWLLTKPPTTLVQDSGDAIMVYQPERQQPHTPDQRAMHQRRLP